MTEQIAVVKIHYKLERAYDRGYLRFSDDDPVEDAAQALSHFAESAEYANQILPKLRAMAGYEKGPGGTYTIKRRVAAIKPGCEEDEPADAELVEGRHVFNALTEAWRSGAIDSLSGNERDPSDVEW